MLRALSREIVLPREREYSRLPESLRAIKASLFAGIVAVFLERPFGCAATWQRSILPEIQDSQCSQFMIGNSDVRPWDVVDGLSRCVTDLGKLS